MSVEVRVLGRHRSGGRRTGEEKGFRAKYPHSQETNSGDQAILSSGPSDHVSYFNISALPGQSPPELPSSVPKRDTANASTTMVKVEIVQDQDEVNNSPYASHASSRTGSSVSLSSVESELGEESLYDRLTALRDIVPPSTRHSISSKVSTTASVFKKGGKILGNIVWIVTTSALLVGLPLALSLEDEAKIVAQEKEMLAQQQGAQQVCTRTLNSARSSCLLKISADAGWRFFDVSARVGATAQGHCSTWFLIVLHVHPTLAYPPLMPSPLLWFALNPDGGLGVSDTLRIQF